LYYEKFAFYQFWYVKVLFRIYSQTLVFFIQNKPRTLTLRKSGRQRQLTLCATEHALCATELAKFTAALAPKVSAVLITNTAKNAREQTPWTKSSPVVSRAANYIEL
jgi:hypothetical protein